jgi:D-amino-acid dehydrogenase
MPAGRVVVVGAGVVGASCAYELSRRGWEVELLDRAEVGGACSKANCGYVCPSHVFPLAKPGAIASTLPLIFKRNSPFAIRPRLDFAMLAWFAKFSKNCRADLVEQTSYALHDLLISSKASYERVIRDESIDAEWEDKGCLFISMHESHADHFHASNEVIKQRFGYCGERLTGKQLAAMEPTLRDDLGGAWFFRCDSHVRSDKFMAGLHETLRRRGVVIREHCEVSGLRSANGKADKASTLDTNQGPITADEFIVATGAWTPKLSASLGIKLPIQPGKGYSLTSQRPPEGKCPTYPMIFEEHRVAITPFRTGFRVGSTMEFAGYDESIRDQRLQLLRDGCSLYLKEWKQPITEDRWFGWRPMTPDGKPFIDRSPKWSNVIVAAGHNMIGMSTGPGTGQLVAEIMSGEKPHFDPAPFRINRPTV